MNGAKGSKSINQACHSERTRKWVRFLTPGNLIKGICDMEDKVKCTPGIIGELGKNDVLSECTAEKVGQMVANHWKNTGQKTWRSLDPDYAPQELAEARSAMQNEPALKGTVCGKDGRGLGVGNSHSMSKLGCFFTRDKNPATFSGINACRNEGWSSDEENDGAVTLESCKAGAKPGWSSKWGKTGELWVTAQNHEDLTCRNGDYGGACSWYGLAE
jgi:hypothetical protein